MDKIIYVVIFINVALGIILWGAKLLHAKMIPIVCLVTVSLADEFLAYYFKIRFKNNLIVYYISSSVEYACIVWFIYLNIDFGAIKNFIRYSVILLFAARLGYLYFFIHQDGLAASKTLDYFITAQDISIAFFSICYFKNIFDHVGDYKPLNLYVLIVVSGLLFYYAFDSVYRLAYSHLTNVYVSKLLLPNSDVGKVTMSAAVEAYNNLSEIRIFLLITNMLLYTCIFIAFVKNAIIVKKDSISV